MLRALSLCCVGFVLLAASATTGAKKPIVKTCKSPSSKTLVNNTTARVFSKKDGSVTRYFGCYWKTARKTQLSVDSTSGDDVFSFTLPKLAGRYVAFVERNFDSTGDGGTVVDIYNLKSGRLKAESIKTAGGTGGPIEWHVTSLVLSSDGSAAWITKNDYNAELGEVWKLTDTGDTQLATGNIDPKSLKLSGTTLTWTVAGVAQSASL